jgi:hypothetical protein
VVKTALGSTDGQETEAALGPWITTPINGYCMDGTQISDPIRILTYLRLAENPPALMDGTGPTFRVSA